MRAINARSRAAPTVAYEAGSDDRQGSVYSNTTPATETGLALPKETMPDGDKIMPAGKAAPLEETANVPP